ncbi:hypothetical protein O1R50_19385 [Glycomyces luteolus]|uniref:Uncharacterized protein n=1 Tax=Glycomyces luteolus TaxID=2670330 RepID=A0A9X3PE36_9ACTN|nr:hypothetical protein [Glycomyces luteolus]MDA1361800.1 hypothetical protein [Glycomyces luteolus]
MSGRSTVRVKVKHTLESSVSIGRSYQKWMESRRELDRPSRAEGNAERTAACDFCGAELVVTVSCWSRVLVGRLIYLLVALLMLAVILLQVQWLEVHGDEPADDSNYVTLFAIAFVACAIGFFVFLGLAFGHDGVRLRGRRDANGVFKKLDATADDIGEGMSKFPVHTVDATGAQFSIDIGLVLDD